MEQKVLTKLEFHKIIDRLVNHCASIPGKELAGDLKPSCDIAEVERWLTETTEAKEVLRYYPNFTLGGIRDIRGSLRKAAMGGVLEPEEFLAIGDTIQAAKRIKSFFTGDGKKYAQIAAYGQNLTTFPKIEEQIKKVITPEGEVSDNASEELARVRRQLRSLQGRVREKLDGLVRSAEMQKYLQDPIITIRNDRYVIPVKQEYRQQVPGLIHDQSASGATLFIEPMAIVEINNEIQRYEAMERAEVIRILRHLTKLVELQHEEMTVTLETLALIDFIFAKAKLSADLDGGQPRMNNKGYVNIVQGRHPLVQGKVVPTTIHLGKDFDTLVITGPNTGGKTVTLKTVGLFILMAQAGLHVPAQAGTELAVFDQVFADIGDEQSIEQSLSTFSSHMTNIIQILDKVDANTLVLLDELGAGTDPTEGAALAMAILDYLIHVGAKTIATTHYSELKSFAYNHERVENASVEFNVETLQPTYRLLIGVPGKSNAFEISKRLGLKPELVEKARSFLSQEEVRVADLIENLETNQLLSERDRLEAEKLKNLARTKLETLEKREQEFVEKVRRITQKAQEEALEIITRARKESEAILKEVREIQKKAQNGSQQEILALRDRLREEEEAVQDKLYKETGEEELPAGDLEPGDTVIIKRLNQKAVVLAKPDHNHEVLVQAGIMKLNLKLRELRKIDEEQKEQVRHKTGAGTIAAAKAMEIKNELDLRGLTVDEAIIETEKYLDDAYLAGLPQAYIIHGKGTGALRSAVSDLVKKHKFVKSARTGGYHEGGHGVTVIEFKK
ncbi:MAG: muts2 family protein [Peptococcaceae bacterium]|nr:muts2 family protein [Peptococcaceae bacterium]